MVAVDFYRTGDLFRVVRTLNGLDPSPRGRPAVACTLASSRRGELTQALLVKDSDEATNARMAVP